jgi:hypothetical protein
LRGTGASAGASLLVGRSRATVRKAIVLLAAGVVAIGGAGCGSHHHATTQAEQLERADLVDVCRALRAVAPAVDREVAATKAAWPLVVHGLPEKISTLSRPTIELAVERSRELKLPGLFEEGEAASITGPGASLASLFRGYSRLATRGWRMIGAAIEEIEHGSPAGARFARANVALYVESVYDGHFELAQIGKKLVKGYKDQGGPEAFGASLTQAEVEGLAQTYSEPSDRLYPHTAVKLGS